MRATVADSTRCKFINDVADITNLELRWNVVEHWLDVWEQTRDGKLDALEFPAMPIQGDKCAYCERYASLFVPQRLKCDGCPVMKFTGKRQCMSSPWPNVRDISVMDHNKYGWREKMLRAVEREYVFLVELALGES